MKKWLLFFLSVLLCAGTIFAQEESESERGEFWISPIAEAAMYSPDGLAYGGGLVFGYNRGTAAIGLKAEYFTNGDGLQTLELNFLFRLYLIRRLRYSGPFLQITGGPVLVAPFFTSLAVPAEFGNISAGLSFGWRFNFGDRWFAEPVIRAGYPYFAGFGISAGVRF